VCDLETSRIGAPYIYIYIYIYIYVYIYMTLVTYGLMQLYAPDDGLGGA
jgi:hypothetical protein